MKTPKLLMDRLPADFHDLLCNWGEVMCDRHRVPCCPPTRWAATWPAVQGQCRGLLLFFTGCTIIVAPI
jgi:hypothetical protein